MVQRLFGFLTYLGCVGPEACTLGGGGGGQPCAHCYGKDQTQDGVRHGYFIKSEIGYNYKSGSAHYKSPTGGTDTIARPNRLQLLGSVRPPLISLRESQQYHQ